MHTLQQQLDVEIEKQRESLSEIEREIRHKQKVDDKLTATLKDRKIRVKTAENQLTEAVQEYRKSKDFLQEGKKRVNKRAIKIAKSCRKS